MCPALDRGCVCVCVWICVSMRKIVCERGCACMCERDCVCVWWMCVPLNNWFKMSTISNNIPPGLIVPVIEPGQDELCFYARHRLPDSQSGFVVKL